MVFFDNGRRFLVRYRTPISVYNSIQHTNSIGVEDFSCIFIPTGIILWGGLSTSSTHKYLNFS
jgi:hypothetical protein